MSIWAWNWPNSPEWFNWWDRRVTGHAQHAVNGAVPTFVLAAALSWWLVDGLEHVIPIWTFTHLWSVFFYTMREKDRIDADGVGDVLWVYALQVELVAWHFGIFVLPFTIGLPLLYDLLYWFSRPAPGWMPRDWTMIALWR